MKIGLVNFTPMVYDVDTPYDSPLGGSESSMCYLAVELAKLGHEATLFGRKPEVFTLKGVIHKPDYYLKSKTHNDLDILIIQNTPYFGLELKPLLSANTKLIFWSQHNEDQAPIQRLYDKRFCALYDGFVFVSNWQMKNYLKTFPLDPVKCKVLGNAVSPAVEKYLAMTDLQKLKTSPPILAYTTLPSRGLEILVDSWPKIHKKNPKAKLKIFSGMSIYQQQEKDRNFEPLFTRLKNLPNVEYSEPVGQIRLAKELSQTSILVYPCIVPETFCITVAEALAAGCVVVTSRLGGIPETSEHLASLVPIGTDRQQFTNDFTMAVDLALKALNNKLALAKRIKKQTNVMAKHTWNKRAIEWERWLEVELS